MNEPDQSKVNQLQQPHRLDARQEHAGEVEIRNPQLQAEYALRDSAAVREHARIMERLAYQRGTSIGVALIESEGDVRRRVFVSVMRALDPLRKGDGEESAPREPLVRMKGAISKSGFLGTGDGVIRFYSGEGDTVMETTIKREDLHRFMDAKRVRLTLEEVDE